jgi:hypothetical protein
MEDYIALVTVELHKFALQIAGGVRAGGSGRLRRVGPMSAMGIFRQLTRGTNKSGTPARKEAGLRD